MISFLLGLACGGQNSTEPEKKGNADPTQKYFTKQNPGIWKAYKEDHTVQITSLTEKYRKIVKVNVPLRVSPDHYIEVMLLQDYRGKELEVKTFKRGENPLAEFYFPAGFKEKVNIIAKCNLHDMWLTEVNLGP